MNPPLVYLSGRIADCTHEEKHGWRDRFTTVYPSVLNPMHRPFEENGNLEAVRGIVEGDKADIRQCDVLLVHYVAPSVGTSMEILFAWELGKMVIVWNPAGCPLSPWIRYHSHATVGTQEEALRLLESVRRGGSAGDEKPVLPGRTPNGSSVTTDPNDPRLTRYTGPEKPGPQAEVYLVLSEEERAKGFIRPVRKTYRHDPFGSATTMGAALAETYARDPKFYGATYCCACRAHFPVDEFKWEDGQTVGS